MFRLVKFVFETEVLLYNVRNLKENFDCVNALLGTSYFSGEAKHISIYDLICICMNLC
jgi:hypothetical protein